MRNRLKTNAGRQRFCWPGSTLTYTRCGSKRRTAAAHRKRAHRARSQRDRCGHAPLPWPVPANGTQPASLANWSLCHVSVHSALRAAAQLRCSSLQRTRQITPHMSGFPNPSTCDTHCTLMYACVGGGTPILKGAAACTRRAAEGRVSALAQPPPDTHTS